MKPGFQISFTLSEFTLAAVLIAIVVTAVGFFHRAVPQPTAACVTKETVVENHYITVPAPIVRVRVIVPKQDPPVLRVPMSMSPDGTAAPKVWDNDNLPSAVDPPTPAYNTSPILTARGRQ
jgi:hypothetical protein